MSKVVCFGELLLRLTATEEKRLLQSRFLEVFCGGAEANVAVSLSRFGHSVDMVSVLPNSAVGQHLLEALRANEVGTSHVLEARGRLGVYYFEPGAVLRPSSIIYDREHSVFARTDPYEYDWETILKDTKILHISGITPALGPNSAEAVSDALDVANSQEVKVSFDGNYREALWKNWNGDGADILRNILASSSVAFINEKDVELIFGESFSSRKDAIDFVFEECPMLKTIAATSRRQTSVRNQVLTGELYTREGKWSSRDYEMVGVTDRIGGGDAFAAGVIHGMLEGLKPEDSVEFATVASVIKHSIPGDWNLTSISEIEDSIKSGALDVRR